MFARPAVPLLFFLLGCASSSQAVREEAAAAAPASASGGAALSGSERSAPLAATRLSFARPGGWSVRAAADGTHLYHGDPRPAIVRMALEQASETPARRIQHEADALAARGATVGAIEVAGNGNYASFSWQGDLGSGVRHGRVAVRRPNGHPGSLIVMSGYWTPASDELAEQVDLVFLTASAE